MRLEKKVPKVPIMLIATLLIIGLVMIGKNNLEENNNEAYYRCALGVNPGYARCATVAGPSTCYPAYKLLGTSKEASIDVDTGGSSATCDGLSPDLVSYYDKEGRFIETKGHSGEL